MQLNRAIIEAAIAGFESQKQKIDATIAELRSQLDGTAPPAQLKRVAETAARTQEQNEPASARKRIAAAQKKRWAEFHAAKNAPAKKAPANVAVKGMAKAAKTAPKRKMSAATKAKLVANLARAAKSGEEDGGSESAVLISLARMDFDDLC